MPLVPGRQIYVYYTKYMTGYIIYIIKRRNKRKTLWWL